MNELRLRIATAIITADLSTRGKIHQSPPIIVDAFNLAELVIAEENRRPGPGEHFTPDELTQIAEARREADLAKKDLELVRGKLKALEEDADKVAGRFDATHRQQIETMKKLEAELAEKTSKLDDAHRYAREAKEALEKNRIEIERQRDELSAAAEREEKSKGVAEELKKKIEKLQKKSGG